MRSNGGISGFVSQFSFLGLHILNSSILRKNIRIYKDKQVQKFYRMTTKFKRQILKLKFDIK